MIYNNNNNNKNLVFYDIDGNVIECDDINKVLFRPATYVVGKDESGRVLMILDESSGKWEFPGGGMEIGENLMECAIREIKEETGYEVELISDLPYHIDTYYHYSKRRNYFYQGISFYILGNIVGERGLQDFAEGENILEVKFFSVDELKELDIVDFQKSAFKKFLKQNL